jgi:7-cyano-7-deazaguanine synthase
MKKAVCLLSGGLDSCVTTYIAKSKGYEVFTLSFNYGQRHKKEIECTKKIAELVKAKKHMIFNIDLNKFGGSSLVNKKLEPEINRKIDEIGKKIPSTYVPARNTVFLSIALAYAETIDADAIFIGVTATDYSGYPDCRPEYIEAFQKIVNLATKKSIEGNSIQIKTPLLLLSKAEIIKKGKKLDVPFDKTWSCYLGKKIACGRCDSCILRLKGFKEAGLKDPIKYKEFSNHK